MGCLACEMLGMWEVQDGECSLCGMFGMWDLRRGIFAGIMDVDLQNVYQLQLNFSWIYQAL